LYRFVKNDCTDSILETEKLEHNDAELIEYVDWMSTHTCTEKYKDQDVKTYQADLHEKVFQGCLDCMKGNFTEKKLFEMFLSISTNDETNCFDLFKNDIIKKISFKEKQVLLKNSVLYVEKLRPEIKYIHETLSFEATEFSGKALDYILHYLDRFGIQEVPKDILGIISLQTNSVSDDSRKELNDLLALKLSRTDLFGFGDNQVERNDLAKKMLKDYLKKAKPEINEIEVYQLNNEGVNEIGDDGVFLTCGIHDLDIFEKKNGERIYLRGNYEAEFKNMAKGLFVPASQIIQLKHNKSELYGVCGGKEYKIEFPPNILLDLKDSINLRDLETFKFQFGEDNVIDAFSTLGLVEEMSYKLATGLKFAFSMKGFRLVSENEIDNLKQRFLDELKVTDIYFPINHSMSLNNFTIGRTKAIEFVFEKKIKPNRTVRLKVYTPRYDNNETSMDEIASTQEIENVLSQRSDEHNNLFILNLSCQAEKTIPQWMHAYTNAVKVSVQEKEILAPVIISSKRAFETGSPTQILKHMEYPFGVLELAAKESNIEQTLDFLAAKPDAKFKASRSFSPISNIGKTFLREQLKKIDVKITTMDGKVSNF